MSISSKYFGVDISVYCKQKFSEDDRIKVSYGL